MEYVEHGFKYPWDGKKYDLVFNISWNHYDMSHADVNHMINVCRTWHVDNLYFNGLAQDCGFSIANVLEIPVLC